MDFDSCFTEQCCKSYYPTCQSFTGVQGAKKSKGPRLQDFKVKTDLKGEKQNYSKDYHCNCFSKSPKCNSERKIRYDNNEEKKLDDCRQAWSQSAIETDWKSRNNQSSTTEKRPNDDYNELEEKVNFLFDIFKGNPIYGSEGVGVDGGDQIKVQGITLSDIWHIFNLNKRMCAAEEGIERLTLVVQQVIDKIDSQGNQVVEETLDINYGHSYESNKMNELKKATTKNRADLLTSLMKTFLKIGTVDEIYSKLNLMPEDEETKSQPVVDHKSNRESQRTSQNASNQEVIMESLSRLREQLDEIQSVKLQHFPSVDNLKAKVEEKECKYNGSKLEVISEQAEFSLQDKLETDMKKSNEVILQNFKEELLHDDGSIALNATTSRLLAQEALLQSSLDKVHYELLTNLDLKGPNEMDIPDVNTTCESDLNVESLSNAENILTCEPETAAKYAHKEPGQSNMKHSKLSDFKDAFKSSLLRNSLNKASLNSIKEEDAKLEPEKPKGPVKSSLVKGSKGSNTLLKPPEKPFRPMQHSPELSSGRRKAESIPENLRPVTAPNAGRKSIVPPTDLRKLSSRNNVKPALLFDKTALPSLIRKPAFSDVKTSNKNLPKQKFFVQTS